MFDAHAHPGTIIRDNALVCSAAIAEHLVLSPYKYKALGTLPGHDPSPDFSIMERAAKDGFHIGEIGLDKRFPDPAEQERIFRTALEIARDYDRFAVIHTVREYERTLSILSDMKIRKFMMHGYTGSFEMAKLFIEQGGIISLSPRGKNAKSFKALLTLPFVTETDMETGMEEEQTLEAWNSYLSEIIGIDIGKRSERIMKEVLS